MNRLGHANCLYSRFHIMHTNDMRAVQNGGGNRRQAAVQTIFGRRGCAGLIYEDATDERLARRADQHRILRERGDQLIEFSDQFEILFLSLSKTDAWVNY